MANQDKSVFVQSHALCFYADTAYAIVLWIMTTACVNNMPEASYDFIKVNTMGVFAHGCGHLLLVYKPTSTLTPYLQNYGDIKGSVIYASVLFGFWYALTNITKDKLGAVRHMSMVLVYFLFHYFFVPGTMGFAYVSTVLIITASIANFSKRESPYYNSESFVSCPVVLMAFVEGFACDAFLKHVGGHLWYDLTIPICFTAYFIYHKRNSLRSASKVKQN